MSEEKTTTIDDLGVAVTETRPDPARYVIVAGVSFDDAGANALRESLRVAALHPGAEVHAVHAVKPATGLKRLRKIGKINAELERDSDELFRFVMELVEREPALADERLRLHSLVGKPVDALAQHCEEVRADLLVVGTNARSGLEALVLGSVAKDVLASARCPVLVARPRDYRGVVSGPAIEPLCEDCAAARAESGGAALWCEWHARPHVRPHTISHGDRLSLHSSPGVLHLPE